MQDNSCGMMAILHVLLNINDSTVVGSRISTYKDLFETISSEMRGTIIAQQTDLIEINNNYEMHHPITIADQKEPKEVSMDPSFHRRTITTAHSSPSRRFSIKWTDCSLVPLSWVRFPLDSYF